MIEHRASGTLVSFWAVLALLVVPEVGSAVAERARPVQGTPGTRGTNEPPDATIQGLRAAGLRGWPDAPDHIVTSGAVAATAIAGDWTQVFPQAPAGAPRSRWGHTAIVDPVRMRMVLFGGFDGRVALDDLWFLEAGAPPVWSGLIGLPGSPSARFVHAAVHDPLRDRMIVFGGFDGTFLNDLWQLSLDPAPSWSPLAASGTPPSGRDALAMVLDSKRDRILVFGGFDGTTSLNDVWALSLSGSPAWSRVRTSGIPPAPRRQHSAVYDPESDSMLIFGGTAVTSGPGFDDVWELSLAGRPRWRELRIGGDRPGPRWGHSTVYDAARERVIFFGGVDLADWRNDAWALSLGSRPEWTRIESAGPLPERRLHHSAIIDPSDGRMIIFGGLMHVFAFDDVWSLGP